MEINPTTNVVQITGKNAQGKTSVLDSIWWALAGQANIQTDPIRHGETKAFIRLNLGEIIITRTFTKSEDGEITNKLKVENGAGAVFNKPQQMLDELLDSLSFDPLAFSRMTPKEKFNALRKFVPGVDFDAIETQNRLNYEDRQNVNRRSKELRAQIAGITIPADLPTAKIDEAALVNELSEVASFNAEIDARYVRRQDAAKLVESLTAKIDEYRKIIDKSEKEMNEVKSQLDSAPPLPDKKSVDTVKEKINQAKYANAMIGEAERKAKLEQEALGYEAKSELLTKSMEAREKEKLDKIAAANLPIPGMSFGDGIVLLNGVPFEQSSDAEQLRAGIVMAMANNPKLRVIRVRDGSLLDSDSMKLLEEIAAEKDFQVWIERVGSGNVGFELENGTVKS